MNIRGLVGFVEQKLQTAAQSEETSDPAMQDLLRLGAKAEDIGTALCIIRRGVVLDEQIKAHCQELGIQEYNLLKVLIQVTKANLSEILGRIRHPMDHIDQFLNPLMSSIRNAVEGSIQTVKIAQQIAQ